MLVKTRRDYSIKKDLFMNERLKHALKNPKQNSKVTAEKEDDDSSSQSMQERSVPDDGLTSQSLLMMVIICDPCL